MLLTADSGKADCTGKCSVSVRGLCISSWLHIVRHWQGVILKEVCPSHGQQCNKSRPAFQVKHFDTELTPNTAVLISEIE